jgi:hypothetical protein
MFPSDWILSPVIISWQLQSWTRADCGTHGVGLVARQVTRINSVQAMDLVTG